MEKAEHRLSIMIAAGGTGGHIFPAQALALELAQKLPKAQITFVGAGLKDNDYFKKDLFPFLDIRSGTPFKKNPLKILKALLHISQGVFRCLKFFSKKAPHAIVGFGSFHTFPALFAAKLKGIPIIIFESNALPGKVNRFCSKWAKMSAIQFSHASKYLHGESVCVQMPLIKKREVTRKEARSYFNLDSETLTILVFGGSQGAQSINRFFCGAVQLLVSQGIDFQVIHIVGDEKRAERLKDFYEKLATRACVKGFEDKMEYAWTAADLNISRSGAATLAELIEFCIPSILIPYPYGSENHQMKNAIFVSDKVQGALSLDEKEMHGDTLAGHILDLIGNSGEKLKEMRKNLYSYKEKENKQDLCSVVLNSL
ncbi:MAG: undecaprenyldiphospho-muramoylpentapeptide beta-N-acetylglucosaminyltransferase [Chlamydiia bacterium]|nr:undecaprenyldiphospho-muramoylpentapeptide beta-N-acetylglucosaminyltransferase [Chlamydiia bacterium]